MGVRLQLLPQNLLKSQPPLLSISTILLQALASLWTLHGRIRNLSLLCCGLPRQSLTPRSELIVRQWRLLLLLWLLML